MWSCGKRKEGHANLLRWRTSDGSPFGSSFSPGCAECTWIRCLPGVECSNWPDGTSTDDCPQTLWMDRPGPDWTDGTEGGIFGRPTAQGFIGRGYFPAPIPSLWFLRCAISRMAKSPLLQVARCISSISLFAWARRCPSLRWLNLEVPTLLFGSPSSDALPHLHRRDNR